MYFFFFTIKTVIDSSSKLQSGILEGNTINLGDYNECVGVNVRPDSENPMYPRFTGQHCLIIINIYTPGNSIMVSCFFLHKVNENYLNFLGKIITSFLYEKKNKKTRH